jgi:hypothetical protein
VAGWVETLKNPTPINAELLVWSPDGKIPDKFFAVRDFAAEVLGLTNEQAEELFDGKAAGDRDEDNYIDDADDCWDCEMRGLDLEGHAARGAEHIRRFMDRYEAQLKAKRV